MVFEQTTWSAVAGWTPAPPGRSAVVAAKCQLALVFGHRAALQTPGLIDSINLAYPAACIVGCSTAGEIAGVRVQDDSVVVTAVGFDDVRVRVATATIDDNIGSDETGASLAAQLSALPGMCHVLVLSDGLHVNGSELVRGLTTGLPPGVPVTGGLAGDGANFASTVVVHGRDVRERLVVAVGFAGERLRIGYGSLGGWDPFGPERLVTRASGNVLYELDGQSALALYKKYLGDEARHLPASGLLFPLSIRADRSERGVVRTILSVNEAEQSLTFAGDIPTGALAQLMRANFDRLVEGASEAARISINRGPNVHPTVGPSVGPNFSSGSTVGPNVGPNFSSGSTVGPNVGPNFSSGPSRGPRRPEGPRLRPTVGPNFSSGPSLALLISCVGRKMVLKQRVEEEVEAVQEVVGPAAMLAGFYSYGEISPFSVDAKCELHNQTMTVTTWTEV